VPSLSDVSSESQSRTNYDAIKSERTLIGVGVLTTIVDDGDTGRSIGFFRGDLVFFRNGAIVAYVK
jgi:hypothetical protein